MPEVGKPERWVSQFGGYLYVDGVLMGEVKSISMTYDHQEVWSDGRLDGTYVPKLAAVVSRVDRIDISTTKSQKDEVCA